MKNVAPKILRGVPGIVHGGFAGTSWRWRLFLERLAGQIIAAASS